LALMSKDRFEVGPSPNIRQQRGGERDGAGFVRPGVSDMEGGRLCSIRKKDKLQWEANSSKKGKSPGFPIAMTLVRRNTMRRSLEEKERKNKQ